MPVVRPLDASLTAKVPVPAMPAPRCVDEFLIPTLCNAQLVDYVSALLQWQHDAQTKLAAIRAAQPKG